MNKIPRCITKNQIIRHYLKLTKKFFEQNRAINNDNHGLQRDKSVNISNHFSKETKETTTHSLISTKKPSSTSSKNNSLILYKRVRTVNQIIYLKYFNRYQRLKKYFNNFV